MDLDSVNEELEDATAAERLAWAEENLDEILHASSFGPEDVAIIHLTDGSLPTLFLDTTYHFDETLELVEEMAEEYGLDLRVKRAHESREAFEQEHGELYETDPDACCRINKVELIEEALDGVDAWITGMRREQSPTRADIDVVERDGDRLKVNPLADWTGEELWSYVEGNGVPYNPLHDQGYPSIGCEPCTEPVAEGEDERAGRWGDDEKTECGLHG